MRIVQTSYPRVKKIYTYDITQEELDELKFTWEEFQDALVEDDHERHMEAYDAWTEFYTDSDEAVGISSLSSVCSNNICLYFAAISSALLKTF